MWGQNEQIGLTLTPSDFEVVRLRNVAGRQWHLEDACRVALPVGIIDPQGQVVDQAALVEALRSAFPRRSRFGPPVSVSFNGAQVLVRQCRLKEMPPREQQEYLVEQTRRYPNFEQGDLALGYCVVEEVSPEGDAAEQLREFEVLALAARQDTVQSLREVLAEVGMKMGPATARALAAFGVPVRADKDLTDRNQLWMAVSAVPAKLVISLWQGSRFFFYREVFQEKESPATGEPPRTGPRRGDGRVVPASDPAAVEQMEKELMEQLVRLRQLALAARQLKPVFDELQRFVQDSPLFNPGGGASGAVGGVPVTQLIKEIKRSLSFHQVVDPAAVPVYLIDFPQAGVLVGQIQAQEPGLRVYPYRLDALPSLKLAGRGPSVAAVGTAMLRNDSNSVIDLAFVKSYISHWEILAGSWRAAVAGLLILAVTLVARFGFIDRWTQAYRNEDARIQVATQEARRQIRNVVESIPGESARIQVQTTLARNKRVMKALAQFLDKGLRESMPAGVWLDDLSLGENYNFNVSGRSTDPLAVLDLAQQMKRIPYLSGLRLLEVDRAPGATEFRFHIIGTLAPPESSQG